MSRDTPLKARRQTDPRDLTQEQVAEILQIHPRYYTEIENGTKRPSLGLLVRIAQFWGMGVDELLPAFKFEDFSTDTDQSA